MNQRPFKCQRKGGNPRDKNGGHRGNGSGNKGSGGAGGAAGGGSSHSHWRRPSKEERNQRYKAGQCILCGHPDHKMADCPHNDKKG